MLLDNTITTLDRLMDLVFSSTHVVTDQTIKNAAAQSTWAALLIPLLSILT